MSILEKISTEGEDHEIRMYIHKPPPIVHFYNEECDFASDPLESMNLHKQEQHTLVNCIDCDFETITAESLAKHKQEKHEFIHDEVLKLSEELSEAKKVMEQMDNDINDL